MKIICTVVSSVAFGFYFLFFRFKKIKNLLIVFSIFNYSLHLEFVKRIMWFCESIVCRFLTSLFNIFSANCFLFQLEIFFFIGEICLKLIYVLCLHSLNLFVSEKILNKLIVLIKLKFEFCYIF